jgi:hypothetical protein
MLGYGRNLESIGFSFNPVCVSSLLPIHKLLVFGQPSPESSFFSAPFPTAVNLTSSSPKFENKMTDQNIKQFSFMDAFFLATTSRSMMRSVEQIAAAEKAKMTQLVDKPSKANKADAEKPATNNAERKRAGGKKPEPMPRRISFCTPCARFMPVYVSEIIFPHIPCDRLCPEKPPLLFGPIFPTQLLP